MTMLRRCIPACFTAEHRHVSHAVSMPHSTHVFTPHWHGWHWRRHRTRHLGETTSDIAHRARYARTGRIASSTAGWNHWIRPLPDLVPQSRHPPRKQEGNPIWRLLLSLVRQEFLAASASSTVRRVLPEPEMASNTSPSRMDGQMVCPPSCSSYSRYASCASRNCEPENRSVPTPAA